MKLDQLMREATDDVVVDVATLTRTARTTGARMRRHRRLASASAVLAAGACVAAVAVTVDVTTEGTAPRTSPAASSPSQSQSPSPTPSVPAPRSVPIDGRSTAALLAATVLDVADGELTDFAGQGGAGAHGPDTYAQLTMAPADGLGSGVVGVNVQDLSILRGQPRACLPFMSDCTMVDVPGGDLLRTYRDPSDSGSDVRLVAELLAESRGLRVVVSATNGFDLGGNRWDITRDAPVLDAAQLRDIVLDERWGFEAPVDLADRGAALAPYDDLDARQGIESSRSS